MALNTCAIIQFSQNVTAIQILKYGLKLINYFLFQMCNISVLLLAAALSVINADVYLHNPRGSNNRLRESSANRANANRLFDSQVSPYWVPMHYSDSGQGMVWYIFVTLELSVLKLMYTYITPGALITDFGNPQLIEPMQTDFSTHR